LGMGWIGLEAGRTIGHSWNRTVGEVDHGKVGWGTGVERMIGVDSWVSGVGSLRIALIRCPACQLVHERVEADLRKHASFVHDRH
jgi:hypothetical protein